MNIVDNPLALRFARFQTNPVYREPERKPNTVVAQTHSTLRLLSVGVVSTDHARDYLQQFTLPFLKTATAGAPEVFRDLSFVPNNLPLEATEAANFTNVVFSCMPYLAQSDFLPDGFSRRGMLRPPQNQAEFLHRTRELQFQLGAIITEGGVHRAPLESNPPLLRTYTFFKIGAILPPHTPQDHANDKEYHEATVRRLLAGIDFKLD